jgi:hypothetical protein
MLRVISGDPTPEELAIILAVVSARGGAVKPREPKTLSLWASKGRQTRPSLGAGFGSWRAFGPFPRSSGCWTYAS